MSKEISRSSSVISGVTSIATSTDTPTPTGSSFATSIESRTPSPLYSHREGVYAGVDEYNKKIDEDETKLPFFIRFITNFQSVIRPKPQYPPKKTSDGRLKRRRSTRRRKVKSIRKKKKSKSHRRAK